MKNFELRFVTDAPVEMRGMPGPGAVISGHGAVFDVWADIGGQFDERVMLGAFKKTIAEADIRGLINHEPTLIIGRNRAGTMRLAEDAIGLAYEIDLPETSYALDLAKSIERGDVTQSSYSFAVPKDKDKWEVDRANGIAKRTIFEVMLFDTGPVTFPAFETTDVGIARAVRSLAHSLGIDACVDSIPELLAMRNSTEEPDAEPQEHSEPTQQPEEVPWLLYV
jgi:HK97 family phage prohead protease